MEHDGSDILGHNNRPVAHGKNSKASTFSMGQSVFIGITLLVVYMFAKRLWKRALLWQERSYKLATRRRHGIPDSDLRPFNVAYSAAVMRAREEESRHGIKSNPSLRPQGRVLDQHDTQPEQTLRYRIAPEQKLVTHTESITPPGPMMSKASASSSKITNPSTSNHEQTFMNHYAPRQSITHSAQASSSTAHTRPLTRQAAYSHIEDLTSDNEGKKRSLEEQEDGEHELKKSRVDDEELVDDDEDADYSDVGHIALKRGSKRGFGEEDEDDNEVNQTKKFRGKRARNISQEKARQSHFIDDNMDIDDEELDEITELTSRSRGKKRDRAEAGSSFGGDDDSEPEDGIKARRRRRKRRTVAKRKSEASHARGKKRDRDTDDDKSDQESEDGSQGKVSRKKRGKRGSVRHDNGHTSRSDVSMDESISSTRGKVRAIGEEWESNGIKYKVGLNGQRLRQALVKQARQKFVMPIDSQHPDRNANVQICIECWLTEEEYQEKKAERMLAWQDGTPPRQEEPIVNLSLDVAVPQLSQSVAGKNLLWSSSTASTPTVSPVSQSPATETPPESARPKSYRDSYRHSIATTVGLPISPFRNSQIPTMKRIASTTRASLSSGSPGLSDSTNGTPRIANKVFSKWEKQELEAQAITKMREANRKKELEREAKLKEEKEKAERAAAERARLEKERLDRERAEKDRAEKERADKERLEKEKAEAERKAKEAAQVPKITVTAPSSENVAAPTTSMNGSSFFPMTPAGSTPAKPVVNTVNSQSTSVHSFFNNTSASTPAANLTRAESAKSQTPFNFSAPSGNSNTGNAAALPSVPKPSFSFPPTAASSTGGQKTEGSAFGPPVLSWVGSPASEPSKPTPVQSSQQPFSFPKPNGLNSTTSDRSQTIQTPSTHTDPSATSSSSTNAPLKFSFNVPGKQTAPNPPVSTTAFPPSSSLSGALGSDQQKTTTGTSGPPTFSFKLPTSSTFASATTTSTTPAVASTSTPRFTFGTSSFNTSAPSSGSQEQNKEPFKPSFGNTGFSSNTGTGSSPFGANTSFQGQNKDAFKSPFGNNALGANVSASQGQKSAFDGGTTAFSKNTGTGPSAFGANPSATQGQKSSFGGGTNTTTTFPNNTSTSSSASPFGLPQTQTQNVFGGGVFGNNSTETPKTVFGNGTSTSTTTTSDPSNAGTTTNTTTTPKFAFPVTTTTPSGTPNSESNAFKFGQTMATTTPQSSPFGASSVFGNTAAGGASSSEGTTTTPIVFSGGGVFGAPASQQQK